MDKKKLSDEIAQNMKQENGIVSLPLEIWNKLAICLNEAEKTKAENEALRANIRAMKAYNIALEDQLKPAATEELIAEPSLHIENFYVTINHFDKE